MKQVLPALFYSLMSTVALAQGCGPSNPNCIVITQPPGSNDTRAASTAFVQNAVTSAGGGNLSTQAPWTPGNCAQAFDATHATTIANPCNFIAAGAVANSQLANQLSGTVKCQPGATGAPVDCTPNQVSNLLGYCVIDGQSFPATINGLQAAINTPSCHDIELPSGTFNGSTLLTIARSQVRIRGQGGITTPQGTTPGATNLNFTCFGAVNSPAVQIGDGSPALTYTGIDISDLQITLPAACNMFGVEVKASTVDTGNQMRRVRITEGSGNSVGAGIFLDQLVYSWRFEDVVIDHFFDGYHFVGQNHFTQIIGGAVRNNQVGFNHRTDNAHASSNIVVQNVDIEGNTGFGFDIWSTSGFVIRDNFIDNGATSGTIGVRVAGSTATPEGVMIQSNYFNNGGTANYAIDLETPGYNGLNIIGNHFNNYAISNILNNAPAAGAQRGVVIGNDWFGSATYATAYTGFYISDAAVNRNFTVSQLPTCNIFMQGSRYFVIDYSGTILWKQAAVGGGSTGVGTLCDGSNWYID